MTGEKRRKKILELIRSAAGPLSGGSLAKMLSVSRQVIVQDVALLKAEGNDIISTNRGYVLHSSGRTERIFKTMHSDAQTEEELNAIVDLGGTVKDVFVWHRVYGKITANLDVSSRHNVSEFIGSLESGRSSPLKNITSNYHYHTVSAESEKVLDMIESILDEKGFLVKED